MQLLIVSLCVLLGISPIVFGQDDVAENLSNNEIPVIIQQSQMFTSSGDSHGKISQTSSVKIHLEGASGNGTIFATNEKSTPNSYDRTELNGTVRYSNTTPLSFNMSSALDYGNEISVKESTTNDWNSLIPGSPLPPAANATIPTNISNSEDKVPPKKMPDVGTIGGICAFALIFIARRR